MRFLSRIMSIWLLCVAWLPASHAQTAPGPTILVVGDSLSAEYGIARGTGWVALLEERLQTDFPAYRVINASISGDTTQSGVNRLPPLLQRHQPAVVIVELGANDALRGLPLDSTRDNLMTMSKQAQAAGAQVVVVGMEIPPNFGPEYAAQFRQLFRDTATQTDAALVPFLLDGIATERRWFQDDGIHPTREAQPRLLDNVWPALHSLLTPAGH
ncbi:arylesterase [Alcaligenaceae bacterium SJ-26]|nr:arylesterase [Alcaligenaceae bacterium SJ-26]